MEWLLLLAPVVLAGLVVIATGGGSPENRNPVPGGSDGAPGLPTAYVVTARPSPTVARDPLVGRILLMIVAGVFLLFLLRGGFAFVFGGC